MKPVLIGCAWLGLFAGVAVAQEVRPGAVSASGSATLEQQPEVLRLRIDLISRGGTLQEALEGLKQRTKQAREQAVELGADQPSIRVEPPRLSAENTDQQRQLARMMQQRLGRAGRTRPGLNVAAPVTVTAAMTAEWKLDAAGPEEVLLVAHPLQERIREADLGGAQAAEKLSPEQEELLEEMQDDFGFSYGDEGPKPGEPQFTFVRAVSDAEREKLLADAFTKAKAEAARLAQAAGAELGPLRSLAGHTQPGDDNDPYGMYRYYALAMGQGPADDERTEAVSPAPGPVRYTVTVQASFALKE